MKFYNKYNLYINYRKELLKIIQKYINNLYQIIIKMVYLWQQFNINTLHIKNVKI